MPDTDTKPLAMSVAIRTELKRRWTIAVAEEQYSTSDRGSVIAYNEASDDEIDALIDARIRPLVEALKAVREWEDSYRGFEQDDEGEEWNVDASDLRGWSDVSEKLDAALKAVESGAAGLR